MGVKPELSENKKQGSENVGLKLGIQNSQLGQIGVGGTSAQLLHHLSAGTLSVQFTGSR